MCVVYCYAATKVCIAGTETKSNGQNTVETIANERWNISVAVTEIQLHELGFLSVFLQDFAA